MELSLGPEYVIRQRPALFPSRNFTMNTGSRPSRPVAGKWKKKLCRGCRWSKFELFVTPNMDISRPTGVRRYFPGLNIVSSLDPMDP